MGFGIVSLTVSADRSITLSYGINGCTLWHVATAATCGVYCKAAERGQSPEFQTVGP